MLGKAWISLSACQHLCPSPLPSTLQVTRAVFEAAKGRLRVVGRAGVGVDNVDLAAATEVGVYKHVY